MDERKEYFESYADEWDKMFTAEDLEVLSFLLDSFNITAGSKVVDLGCGTGVLFDMLRRKVTRTGLVVGVDFSTRMIKRAKRNFPFENVYVIDADVEHLPIMDNSVDYAISFAAFAHFTDPAKVMAEASRILKPGGNFHIIHLASSRELQEHHHMVGGPVQNDRLPPYDEMMKLFDHGHFINVKITDHPGLYLASGIKS